MEERSSLGNTSRGFSATWECTRSAGSKEIFLIDVVTLITLPSAGIITMLSLTPRLQVVLDLLQIPFDGKEDVRMNELMRLAHQFLQNFCLGNQNNQVSQHH